MGKKHKVVNKHGVTVRMSDTAMRMAERYFGINKQRVGVEVPIELLKLPKTIQIIKAKPEVKVIEAVKSVAEPDIVKSEVKSEIKPEVKIEVKSEIKPEIKPEVKAVVKPVVKRKRK